jgi:hypothetical protein
LLKEKEESRKGGKEDNKTVYKKNGTGTSETIK